MTIVKIKKGPSSTYSKTKESNHLLYCYKKVLDVYKMKIRKKRIKTNKLRGMRSDVDIMFFSSMQKIVISIKIREDDKTIIHGIVDSSQKSNQNYKVFK